MKGNYVSIHSSGFRDFLLKPEVLRAIVDCGFEHPSEIQHECIPQVRRNDSLDDGRTSMMNSAGVKKPDAYVAWLCSPWPGAARGGAGPGREGDNTAWLT